MDVVGALGYSGQELVFFNHGLLAYVTGRCVSLIDVSVGPRELIWRHETGINKFITNTISQKFAIVPAVPNAPIEILNMQTMKVIGALENPTGGSIIDAAFSRNGDLLCGLSDTLDRNVFVCDVNSAKLLLVFPLSRNFSCVSFNPIDSTQIFLHGEGGISVGNIQDLLDVHVLKLMDTTYEGSSTITFGEEEFQISCSVWLPNSRVVFGTLSGHLFDVDIIGNKVRAVGSLLTEEHATASFAQSLLLTMDHLIIGQSNGLLYWLPIASLLQDVDSLDAMISAKVVQIATLRGSVTSLVADPLAQRLFAGTDAGTLNKFSLTVQQRQRSAEEEDPAADEAVEQEELAQTVVGERVATFQDGAVVCVCSLSTPIIGTSTAKIAKKSSHLLSLLVTGSHLGRVNFWKQPATESEQLSNAGNNASGAAPLALRRSVPKPLKLLSVQELYQAAAPCCMSSLPVSVRDGTCALGVGTASGHLEVFKFDAIETDDDDEDVSPDAGPVDEDGMRLSVWPIARYKLFEKSLTCISRASDWESKGSPHLVAVGSYFDPRVFVLVLDDKDGYDINLALTVSSEQSPFTSLSPTGLCWADKQLHICLAEGVIASYATKTLLGRAHEVGPNVYTPSPDTVHVCHASTNRSSRSALPSAPLLGLHCLPHNGVALLGNSASVYCLQYQGRGSEPSDDGESSISASADADSLLTSMDPFLPLPSFGLQAHADVVLCLCVSPHQGLLATGNTLGAVFVWQIGQGPDGADVRCLACAALHNSAVVAASFAADSSLLICCGADGSVFVLAVDRPQHIEYEFETSRHSVRARKYQHSNTQYLVVPAISAQGIVRLWIDEKKDEERVMLQSQYSDAVAEVIEGVQSLAQRLKILLDRNAGRTDLEKMGRGEFAVDLRLRDSILAQNASNVAQIRENYRLRDYWNELQAARVKAQCYDSMQNSSRSLLPFNSDNTGDVRSVSAFSVPRVTEVELAQLKRIRRLRIIEMRSQRQSQAGFESGKDVKSEAGPVGCVQRLPGEGKVRSCWAPSVQGTSTHLSWLWGEGSQWPTPEVSTYCIQREAEARAAELAGNKDKEKEKDKDGKEKDKAAAGAGNTAGATGGESPIRVGEDDDERSLNSQDAVNEVDETDLFNLLYSPLSIRTDVQKRIQLILLKEAVRAVKNRFNDHFERAVTDKETVLSAIESRNQRISAILEELKAAEDVWSPSWGDEERKGSAVVVRDDEVSARPFETEAMRIARIAAEEEARRREAADDKKEALARALQDMMHGTLEVKRNVLEEANALVRPAWMNEVAEADMTEAQLKEYDAFNVKFRALQEEQALYRKQLEQELKRLRGEVVDLAKSFDDRLLGLHRIKVLTARAVLTHELYMSRLGSSVLKVEAGLAALAALDGSLDKAKKERKDLQARIERFCVHCEEVRAAHLAADGEYRSMEKQFKTHLLNACGSMAIDSEKLRVLQVAFNERSYPRDEEDEGAPEQEQEHSAANDNHPSKRGNSTGNSKEASRNSRQRGGGVGRRSAQNNMANAGSHNNTSHGGLTASRQAKPRHGHMNSRGAQLGQSRNSASASRSGMNVGGMGPLQEAALALQKTAGPEETLAERDPFTAALARQERVRKAQESQIPLLRPLTMDDLPEGFAMDNLQFVFSKVQELRLTKLAKEVEAKRFQIRYNDLKVKLDAMHADEVALEAHARGLRAGREELLCQLRALGMDLELVLALKQGQDEVNNDAIVTDYGDAVCLPVSVVQRFNSRIKELGRDRIGMLTKIKTFRRKINLVDWEAKHLSLECRHLEEYYTDLQLFRVTRELQQILREGSDAERTKERLDKVSQRKDFLAKDGEQRLGKLRRAREQMRKQLSERGDELAGLEKRVGELRVQVAERQSVQNARHSQTATALVTSGDMGGSGHGASAGAAVSAEAASRMKGLIARRHLVDTARAQAEEIDFLRAELDKARQRTFPSFIRAVKQRLPNPDERL